MIKKIVAIGPESTGKSVLCEQLADHYKTIWCPEYAREYLVTHGNKYNYDDLLTIAKGQLQIEDSLIEKIQNSKFKTQNLGFIDTDMYVMKVWAEFVFQKCHRYILEQIIERKYDLYLFCNIDLPWVKDELREYPDLESRERLYYIYKDILVNQSVPWVSIHGSYENRLKLAITAVDNLMKS